MRLGNTLFGLLVVCCALVVMPSAAVAQLLIPDGEAEAAFSQGQQLLEQESFEEAFAQFSIAIELNDTYGEAYFGRAEALRELEDFDGALQNYTSAIDTTTVGNELKAAAYNGRGVCYKELNQFQVALTDFQTAIELDRTNPEIAANLGDILINQVGDPRRAIKTLTLANQLDPENAEVLRNLGWSRVYLKEYEDAIEDLKKSVELDPSEHKTHLTLSQVYIAEEDYQLAIDSLGQAIENYEPEEDGDPDVFISGYLLRADVRSKLADMDDTPQEDLSAIFEAVIVDCDAVLEEYEDRYPNSGVALYHRGMALRMLGRYSEAIKSLTDAAQLVPPGENAGYLAEAYLKRGICWHNQQEEGLARRDFDQASSVNFEDPRAYLWIGITYAQEKEYRRAIEYYSEAISKGPSFVLAHVNKGLAYLQLEEYEKAVDSFNEAIASEPSEGEHYYKRGFTYRVMGKPEKSLSSYELAILNSPDLAKAYRDGAAVLRELGRSELADQWETKARELDAEAV